MTDKEHRVKIIDLSKEDPKSLLDANGQLDMYKIQSLVELANPNVETETSFSISSADLKNKKYNPDYRLDVPFLKNLSEKIKKENSQVIYKIVRYFKDPNRQSVIVQNGLTLEEARHHCSLDSTKGEDWFDGYSED